MSTKGLVGVVFASGLLWAQVTTATISGTVADPAGAPLSHVQVVVTCIDNGRVWSVHTDKEGRFTAPDLPLGEYVLGAFSAGFATPAQTGYCGLPGECGSGPCHHRRKQSGPMMRR